MGYYIAPRFLDKLAVHITKNFLNLPAVSVPLILGVHGRKGEGKSFQCELVFERMGIEFTLISGGELESPDAGDPARLIRLRYRETAELTKVRGKMCVLMINDLDAGAGRFDEGTQYTVNTQLVNATLMNIADNPTDVQLPGSYDPTPLPRIPIIVTGNDFSTLYAPLIRDGRMEKFYWEPDRDDKVGIVGGIFEPDGLARRDIEQLVDTFINQSIDFFSALRSRIYDEQIRHFIHEVGFEKVSKRVVNSVEGPPQFKKPNFKLPYLIEMGNLIVGEQQRVQNSQLVEEYNRGLFSRKVVTRVDAAAPIYTNNAPVAEVVTTVTTPVIVQELAPISAPTVAGVGTLTKSAPKLPVGTPFHAPATMPVGTAYKQPVVEPVETPINSSPIAAPVVAGVGTLATAPRLPVGTPFHTPNASGVNQAITPVVNNSAYYKQYTDNTQLAPGTHLSLETQELVREILAQGHKIGIEHVDERRFRMGSWQSSAVGEISESSDVISAIESCLGEFSNEYIRLVAIDPRNRRRVMETIIQRPSGVK
ncbi:ribulose bisphosphate carboxylase small chain [Calothrix sp. NIES-4071]|nr:ribulose bisphosphate carboxylase small chain [Calothrix sp. NIES-4071]BAZ63487.1 ribulose bisphosphate carboxylase small chain [Calothrix sp. NIES-4105]